MARKTVKTARKIVKTILIYFFNCTTFDIRSLSGQLVCIKWVVLTEYILISRTQREPTKKRFVTILGFLVKDCK